MGWFAQALDKLDSLLSWWERLAKVAWIQTGVATVTFYLGNLWAGLTEQPLIIHVTISLAVAASCTILFTFLPALLRKWTHPSFAVLVPEMLYSKRSLQMRISIVNRSPKNRIVLEFAVCIQEKGGKQTWFSGPEMSNVNPVLRKEDKTEGMLIVNFPDPIVAFDLPSDPEIFLQIIDRISTRRIYFKVPGSYP